ncbi:lichenan operon transcriptional antiterminator [Breznakia blatticola]|uniref:Lichenan operon transcriptional antiterminator n=1 Tax=Breznakia blatticola TaxID=1754012 RepID=A0A4R8A836_9FIRM|nr:PRD domain-containing protein [Breznakia blatticola]TDW25805.1 lichenan operon transcriptional antiterminator [Breznakia blatticola]
MNKYQEQILRELMSADTSLTNEALGSLLQVSAKTIQRNTKDLKIILQVNGAILETKPSVGSTLHIHDQNKFNKFLALQTNHDYLPSTPEERITYILDKLLYSHEYIKTSDLANRLFISQSCLAMDIKKVREILIKNDLEIISKPNYGIKIQGSERNIRLAMAEQYTKRRQNETFVVASIHNDSYKTMLNEVISQVLITENLRMSDVALESLVIHLLIAIERLKTNNVVKLNEGTIQSQSSKSEYQTAVLLQKEVEKRFGVTLPQSEIAYLSQHLSGKKHFDANLEEFQNEIDDKYKVLVNTILRAIFDQTRIDFYNDLDLKMNLLLHIIPFVNRIENNMQIKNPIINDIKENHSFAYELASIGLHSVCDKLQIHVSEDEISYFALHFILALERTNDNIKYNILIVCNTGKATSQLLAYQMQRNFEQKINTIRIVESYVVKTMDVSSYDYIFSTVPLDGSFPIPVHYINNILSDKDLATINGTFTHVTRPSSISHLITSDLFFTNIDANSKEEAISTFVKQLSNVKELPDNFEEEVLEREHFSSTELNNLVAIPHPNKALVNETFIAVGILNRPICWNTKKVQIMFLIAIQPNNKANLRDFYESLVDFTMNEDNPKKLVSEPTYENLLTLIQNA